MKTKQVAISQSITVGSGQPLALIAGPCQIESLEHSLMIAVRLQEVSAKLGANLIFKASFDKANRTSLSGARGLGIDRGLEILAQVRDKTGIPVLTDIHSPEQAERAAQFVDVLQTPAFLCRQTDLLAAAGKTGKPINIKKGQFLPPEDMKHAAEKAASADGGNVMLCERGATFGYRDLIVDMRSLVIMRALGYPVVFDATHSVQSLGGAGGASGGDRRFVLPLAKAAAAVGIDAIFIECHQDPDSAPSDSKSMVHLDQMEAVLTSVCRVRQAAEGSF